jgi:glycine cleavage system aminomethyltransferase T
MSGAYAHTLGAAAGLAMVDAALLAGEVTTVQVDCAGTLVKATLSTRSFYDPTGSRMRA